MAPTRRSVVFFGLATFSAGLLTGCAPTVSVGQRNHASRSPVILVHGAWHGGWCWEDVRELLEASGYRTFAPTMAGLAERADEMSPEIGLETHIADVVRVIADNNLTNVILMGHSYGGMVITGVADRMKDRLKHVVYLDAALPQDGDSMISYNPDTTEEAVTAAAKQLRALSPDGVSLPSSPATLLGIPTDHPRHDWTQRQLTAHPLKTWFDPISLTNDGPANIAKTYAHCVAPVLPRTGFPAIAKMARESAEWRYAELQTGHDAMITAPAEVAALITSLGV